MTVSCIAVSKLYSQANKNQVAYIIKCSIRSFIIALVALTHFAFFTSLQVLRLNNFISHSAVVS